MKIETQQRPSDWMAYLDGRPDIWEAGKTEEEAIEKLRVTLNSPNRMNSLQKRIHQHYIKHPGETARQCARGLDLPIEKIIFSVWIMVNDLATMREESHPDGIHYFAIQGEIGDVNE